MKEHFLNCQFNRFVTLKDINEKKPIGVLKPFFYFLLQNILKVFLMAKEMFYNLLFFIGLSCSFIKVALSQKVCHFS